MPQLLLYLIYVYHICIYVYNICTYYICVYYIYFYIKFLKNVTIFCTFSIKMFIDIAYVNVSIGFTRFSSFFFLLQLISSFMLYKEILVIFSAKLSHDYRWEVKLTARETEDQIRNRKEGRKEKYKNKKHRWWATEEKGTKMNGLAKHGPHTIV